MYKLFILCNQLTLIDDRLVKKGSWDSIHVIEVIEGQNNVAVYKLTTTVMLNIGVDKQSVGETSFSGSLTRQVIVHTWSTYSRFILCILISLS